MARCMHIPTTTITIMICGAVLGGHGYPGMHVRVICICTTSHLCTQRQRQRRHFRRRSRRMAPRLPACHARLHHGAGHQAALLPHGRDLLLARRKRRMLTLPWAGMDTIDMHTTTTTTVTTMPGPFHNRICISRASHEHKGGGRRVANVQRH